MKIRNSVFLWIIFLFLCISVVFVGEQYKKYKVDEYTNKKYSIIAHTLSNEVSTLIKEKKNATLAIAISFSKSDDLREALIGDNISEKILRNFSTQLQEETDFKNVWVQLIDKNGISLLRNWTSKKGDDLSLIRDDVKSMNNKPEIRSSISVGRFDMSFKAMVPIYDKKFRYLGYIELITHFNSIAKKIQKKGFEPVVIVDKKYKKQITKPFSKLFVGDNYIANKDADRKLVKYIAEKGISYFISPNDRYIIDKEKNNIVVNYTLFDTNKQAMANFLMFKTLKSIDFIAVESMRSTINLFVLLSIVLSAVFFYFISNKESIEIDIDSNKNIIVFGLFFFSALCGIL